MDWIQLAAAAVAGYSLHALVIDVRYPLPKHKWNCAKCPLRIGASDREVLQREAEKHMAKAHGVSL